jgi:putative NADPH-quinone reductase
MQNLFILGSPRRNGNSETMAKAVAAGLLQESGNSVEFIYLNALNIRPCQGCGGCSGSGNCIIEDDMTELYEKTDAADHIFFVSPVYFYAMSAQIKAYIDRFQAKWSRKYLLGTIHRPEEHRTGHLLSCAATSGDKLFEGSILTIKCLCDTLDLQYEPPLLIKNVEARQALKNLPDQMAACETYGIEIVSSN